MSDFKNTPPLADSPRRLTKAVGFRSFLASITLKGTFMNSRFLLLICAALLLAGCGAKNSSPRHTAEQYFQDGERFFESRLYEEAIASWEKVRDTYYSPELNMLAELKIAEAYYLSEHYPEAALAYADFLQQHPNDSRYAEVLYQLGLSHYRQMLSADRDQTSTENALRVFEEYLSRFPQDRRVGEVAQLILECRNRLTEHEVYVGRFYLRTGKYQAAIHRLEQTLRNNPGFAQRDEAYLYLGRAYLESGERARAEELFDTLLQQFPNSEHATAARKLLAK
jgi:outer membrane protein assembly factor BamD